MDHEILLSKLGESIHDKRFLRLISSLLKAGYLEDWKYNATLSGCPQGSIVGPILSNIYLDRLDKYVEEVLLPKHNRGKRRKYNLAYHNLITKAGYHSRKGHKERADALRKQARTVLPLTPTTSITGDCGTSCF